ncbi:response regulator [Methylobacterium sp. JK268]
MGAADPTLLIVEDEVVVALDVEDLAQEAGFRIAGHALRGADAIALAERVRPDVALVDLQLLDGPTGLAVGRRLAEELGTLVVFMTANRQNLPPDLCGACGVIAKPYTQSGLLHALAFLHGYAIGRIALDTLPACLELARPLRDRPGGASPDPTSPATDGAAPSPTGRH